MKKTRAIIKTVMIVAIALLLTISTISTVLAPPPPFPMMISGYVYVHRVDGTDVAAPDGLHIYTKMDGDTIAETMTSVGGYYAMIIEVEAAWDGEPADLWVQSVNVTRITLVYMSPPVELDLLMVDTTPPTPPTDVACTSPATDTFPNFGWTASTDDLAVEGYYTEIGDYPTYSVGDVTSWESPDELPDGDYTFYVWATDLAGNNSTKSSKPFTISVPPETGTLSVDTTPVKGEVFVDGASWGTAPQSQVVNVGIYTVTFGDVSGYTKPDPVEATVSAGVTTDIMGTYAPITEPDFTITVSPTSGPVLQGESTTPTVTITSINGYSETISLSASGQPTNVSVSFNPTSDTPTFTSTMTINVEDAEPGPHTITITGTGADTTTHTTTYTLTVIEVYVHTETVTDSGTVNATGADTTVDINATGNHTITVSKYESNPGTGFAGDTGKYIDVHLDDPTNVTEIEIRLYYTDAEIAGLVESSLRMHWCNGTDWVTCCTTGVNTTDTDGYSGYMWVRITSETTPSLTDLTGTPFGAAGEGTERPVGGIFGYVNRLYLLVYMNQWLITGILMLIAGICTVLYWRKQKTA